jgi:hypothetical protein
MAGRRNRDDVNAEVDLHGLTAEQARLALQRSWPGWRGMRSVRIVHGQGAVLKPEIVRWCSEMGIPCLPDDRNPGALRILPLERKLPAGGISNTLRDSGLTLTVEEAAYLRDPAAAERARLEAERRKALAERQRLATEAARAAQASRDEALWQAEMARLGVTEKTRATPDSDDKPRPPVVIPKLQIRVEEGYWKAELSRVAETDTATLQTQKRTGLDKLAPPMKVESAAAPPEATKPPPRDVEADAALFEAELDRLGDSGATGQS